MAEVKKIATRESYGNALVELGQENPNVVVLDADLAAATKTGMFKKAFPERHPTDLAKETCYKHLFLGCIYCLFSLFDHDGDYIIFSLNQKNFRICYFFHILKFFYSL